MRFGKHICEPPWQNVNDNDQLTGVKMSERCMICSCCESKKKSKCFAHSPCQKLRNARQGSFLLSMVVNASRERCQKRCSIFSGRKLKIGCASDKFSTTVWPPPPFCLAEFVKIAIPTKCPTKMWRWRPEGHHLNKQGQKHSKFDLQPHHSGSNCRVGLVVLLGLPCPLLMKHEAILMEKTIWQRIRFLVDCLSAPASDTVFLEEYSPCPDWHSTARKEKVVEVQSFGLPRTKNGQEPIFISDTGLPVHKTMWLHRQPSRTATTAPTSSDLGRSNRELRFDFIFTPVTRCASEWQPSMLRGRLQHITVLGVHPRLWFAVCSNLVLNCRQTWRCSLMPGDRDGVLASMKGSGPTRRSQARRTQRLHQAREEEATSS